MGDMIRALRSELADIEVGIGKFEAEASKIQARLRLALDKADKIKAVLALYIDEEQPVEQARLFEPSIPVPPVDSVVDVRAQQAARAHNPPPRSKAARIKAEVTELLSARGTEHRLKILDHLIGKGLMGHEKTPLASLAAYLSGNRDTFVADGRGNFSLRRESHREPPPVSNSGAGSAEEAGSPVPSTSNHATMGGGIS